MINVTRTFIPPIKDYQVQLERIWNNKWLTNRGELVQELEAKLMGYLEVSNILVMNNGTIPIQIALKLLGQYGEIITSPFSYVATTSSIVWENCKPVFVDIHPEYWTIDESKIEAAITERTTCILATHVFGNPCNVEAIEKVALKYNLKVIYDAAHCFGVKYKGKSIFEYGDVSTCSFHATKVFHTGEGGGIFCKDNDLRHKIFYSHTFGHLGPIDYYGVGINGKISELQAAMGLAVLPNMESILGGRKQIVEYYNFHFDHSRLQKIKLRESTDWNYSYFPLVFETESRMLEVQLELNNHDIFPRRYFYPSLNKLPYVSRQSMPISEDISNRILCIPLYFDMESSIIIKISNIINQFC